MEIRGNALAQRLMEQIINNTIDIETPAGQTQFVNDWNAQCPDLPMPCVLKDAKERIVSSIAKADLSKSDFWYLTQLKSQKIVQNLEGAPQSAIPCFDKDEVILADIWEETNWNAPDAKQKHQSSLLKELLGDKSTVNIKREVLDIALWQGDPADRVPNKKHKEILEKLGVNPNEFQLRCIQQDEYARLAESKAWGQKELWTNYDHYFLGGDGTRHGLYGGSVGGGGPSRVVDFWRGRAGDGLAVRLVLSRN